MLVTEEASRYKNEWWNFKEAFKGLGLSRVLKDEMQRKLSKRKLEFFWMVPIGTTAQQLRELDPQGSEEQNSSQYWIKLFMDMTNSSKPLGQAIHEEQKIIVSDST